MDTMSRILANVKESETIAAHVDTKCLIWQGSKEPTAFPYGVIAIERKTYRVHRLLYKLTYGEIPRNLYVLHRCDVPSCCNIDHLFTGTSKDNTADMLTKGRSPRIGLRVGEKNPNSSIDKRLAILILAQYANGERICDIATEHNITKKIVQDLVLGNTWTHLPRPERSPLFDL